jgi:hypothetical protein
MATKLTVMKVSKATAKRVRELKKDSGVALGKLADLGLDHLCDEIEKGNVVIQNGQILPVAGAAR